MRTTNATAAAPSLLDETIALQRRHEATTSADGRKGRGQVFTPPSVCRFMAGMFAKIPERFRLLDPGAGVGSLSAAVCDRLLALRSPRRVEIALYENDASILPHLEATMKRCRAELLAAGHELTYAIHEEDFLLDTHGRREQRLLFDTGQDSGAFDAVIMNPPYFKVAADSSHAAALGEAFRGNTNIYMLFMARAAELLRPGGELVAITPRSFCNGLYFRNFRRWFFARMTPLHFHLFECRRSTFDDVLQESLITHARRLDSRVNASPTVAITTSTGRDIPDRPEVITVPTAKVLDDTTGDMAVRIPSSAAESTLLDVVESWPDRFAELGLRISTGPVVLFRAEEFLLQMPDGEPYAPLLAPHNVRPFKTSWPVEKRGKPTAFRICPGSLKHLVPARNYVLLRRFSAKEERRRLTASGYLQDGNVYRYLALENHLNYVYHADRDLTPAEVHGLTAMFNSALLDRYFRIISGNTQVNATEIRTLRFPSLVRIAAIGDRVMALDERSPTQIEEVVLEVLEIYCPLAESLMEFTS